MSKEAFYFPHDYEAIGDPKLQALVGEFGAVGYGVFWRIIEMLHSDQEHKLPLKQYIYIAIAKQMLTSAEQIEAIVKQNINVYELFDSDGQFFWSDRVNRNFEMRAQLSEKRSVAGKLGAIAKQNLAKLSKGKEKKEKEIKNNNIEERETIFLSEVWQYKEQYSEEMLKAFINYWTEKNRSRTKMLWETKETFEISKRLSTWANRNKSPFTKTEEPTKLKITTGEFSR